MQTKIVCTNLKCGGEKERGNNVYSCIFCAAPGSLTLGQLIAYILCTIYFNQTFMHTFNRYWINERTYI